MIIVCYLSIINFTKAKGGKLMKIALGIHVGHDRGACIIIDGVVQACLANERIDRVKYSQSLQIPFKTIDTLLSYCNLTIHDVNVIGLSGVAFDGEKMRSWYEAEFYNYYQCKHIPLYLISHHEAHAYSVYYSSLIVHLRYTLICIEIKN